MSRSTALPASGGRRADRLARAACRVLLVGAGLLVARLPVAQWLPRRRVTGRTVDGGLRLPLRHERFDRGEAELPLLRDRLISVVGSGNS